MSSPAVQVENLHRVYHLGARQIPALCGVNLTVTAGRLVLLRGRSGSGKTTLLNCIGGLDRPTSGTVCVLGHDITRLPEAERVALRRSTLAFVFQSHALIPTYSAAENIDLALRLAGLNGAQRRQRAQELLALVGLEKWMDHRPHELSGGQQQRIAIARAIAPRPALILADEPTGELDTETGRDMLHLFQRLSTEQGTTVLLASHDPAAEEVAQEVVLLRDGRVEQRDTEHHGEVRRGRDWRTRD